MSIPDSKISNCSKPTPDPKSGCKTTNTSKHAPGSSDWLDYEQFLQLLDDKLHINGSPEEMAKIRQSHENDIKQATSKLDPSVQFSQDFSFINLINDFANLIQDEKDEELRQVHYRDFIDELRQYTHRRNCDIEKGKLDKKRIQEINQKAIRIKMEIKLIEKKLADYESRELSLDELDDVDGIYSSKHPKLLQKLKRLLRKLYELQQMKLIGSAHGLRKFNIQGSGHKAIDEAINDMLNEMLTENYSVKKRAISKLMTPDFSQILELVSKVNTKHNLKLHSAEKQAEVIFNKIGQEMKRRRERAFDDMLSYYELNYREERQKLKNLEEDPDLQERLRSNDTVKEDIEIYLERFAQNAVNQNDVAAEDEEDDDSLDSESDSETRSEDSLSTLASDTELVQDKKEKTSKSSNDFEKSLTEKSKKANKRVAENNSNENTNANKRMKIKDEEKSNDAHVDKADDQGSDKAAEESKICELQVVDLSSDNEVCGESGTAGRDIVLLDSD